MRCLKGGIIVISILVLFGGYMPPILAYVMESDNYRLQRDTINFGGTLGTSDSYTLEDSGGEMGGGFSSGDSYKIHGGFQQADDIYVSIVTLDDVSMSPSIGGLTGGTSNGSRTVTISTNNNQGYTMQVKVSTDPAMKSGSNSIADYTREGADPDYDFSIDATTAEFGFTAEGSDIVQRYLDNGSSCNQSGGSDTADKCWDDISTTNRTVSQSNTYSLSGTDTVLKFRVESGSSNVQAEGAYTATVTVTAYAN